MANDVAHPALPESLDAARSSVVEDARPMPLFYLCLLALFVGIVGGLGAVVFRGLIGIVHNLMFLGTPPSSTTPACSRRLRHGECWSSWSPSSGRSA